LSYAPAKFHSHIPQFKIVKQSYSELFNFIHSGGVIAKTFSIPPPMFMLKALTILDSVLANPVPSVFALQRQVVLKKAA